MSKPIGLTLQDLLFNPALFHSPQFKRLPLKRQFQLTTAYKNYLAIYRPIFYINDKPETVKNDEPVTHDMFETDIKLP